MRIELKMMGKGALIGIRLLWRSILILENLFIESFSIASSNSSFWPFIMARTKDHVLKSLPVTVQQIVSCVDCIKNCLKNEMLNDDTAQCSIDTVLSVSMDHMVMQWFLSYMGKIGLFLTAGYYFIIYIEWAKIDLWAFTVFFEAMILKWMNLKIMISGHIVELPVENAHFR